MSLYNSLAADIGPLHGSVDEDTRSLSGTFGTELVVSGSVSREIRTFSFYWGT